MKWIGQHIWDFISRFRNDVYFEDLSSSSDTRVLVVDDTTGKVSYNTSAGGGGGGTVNDLDDANTSGVAANDILVWNGSSFVVESMTDLIANPTLYTFSTTSFDDGISGTQLIGSGSDWKAIDAITFSAVYVAGPPGTSATIQKAVNSGTYTDMNSMDAAAFTSGNNDTAVAYPSAKDQYIRFRLKVVHDGVTTYTSASSLYFRNKVFYGASTSTSLDEAGVEGLSSVTTSSYTTNRSINATSNKYLYIAFPATYTDIHDDGFIFGGITCPFEAKETVNITNSAGYAENYDVYRSTNHTLGNSTLQLSTSDTSINKLYYGVTTVTSGIDMTDFVSSSSITSNDHTRTWPSITGGSGQYFLLAWPTRCESGGAPTFSVGGFDGGFEAAQTANFTNANGFTEEYKFYRSTNSNLGAQIVATS